LIYLNGAEVWSRIEGSKLRKSLDDESLKIIQPLLASKTEISLPLRDDTERLGRIYSYLHFEKLFKTSFRKNLFQFFDDEELSELMNLLGINKWNRDEMINALIEIPWNSNAQAKIISEFIDMPAWILDLHDENIGSIPENSVPWIRKYELIKSVEYDQSKINMILSNRSPFKRLKNYQNRVYMDAMKILSKNNARVILNMPTGTGKTRTCMELVCAFLQENTDKSVVWLADKVELIDQACLEFHDTWEFLGDRTIPIRRWVKNSPIGNEGKSEFICATFGTLLSRGDGLKSIEIGLVVIDEAHKAIAPQWNNKMRETIIQIRNSTKLIGLTATPERSSDSDSEKLVDFFHHNRLTIKEQGTTNLMDWLEQNEYLSIPYVDTIKAEFEMKLTDYERKKVEDMGNEDYPSSILKKLASKLKFNEIITEKLKELLDKNPNHRILYFGTTVQQSKMIMSWLIINGYTSFHIDAGTDPRLRKTGIAAFRSGNLQVLCNYGVLTTGFDAPLTDVVMIARPTSSPVTYHQMVGRGLRGPKLGGSARCRIIDVDFNFSNHGTKRRQLYKHYRDLWRQDND